MKLLVSAATAIAALALVPFAPLAAMPADDAPSATSASAALSAPRQVEVGEPVTVSGRVPRKFARATVTLRRGDRGVWHRMTTGRVDARRHFDLRTNAPRTPGTYAYEVVARAGGAARRVKKLTLSVLDPSVTPTPTPTPVATGPKGDPDDWTYLGGTKVARWDPCKTITWSVTGAAPYAESQADLVTSFARISTATGLSFVQVTNPETSTFDVTWTNAAADPRLAGSVVGVGGFKSYAQLVGPNQVVSGYVLLDTEHSLPAGFSSSVGSSWGKVMLHEIGHAVGLGHAAGLEQVMYPHVVPGTAEFGAGDLSGFHAVGAAQGCFPTGTVVGRKAGPALTEVSWE